MKTRRWHFLATILLGAIGASQTTNLGKAPAVLFVCEHGAAKSIIAAAEFNKQAEQKGLPHRAISRGTNPDAAFAPAVISGLAKDGFARPSGKPQLISAADVGNAERVVTLGCKLPERLNAKAKPVDWADISSPSQNYDGARKDIARHVKELVDSLARERSGK
ncbi:MAG TPA: hypothetical protein VFB63_15810 [Bryobacteraceae bacterium]|jgi:arsenate reductase (thioredoxin)|nr:hypothetical protein [Bryobacteraceae bacterium]